MENERKPEIKYSNRYETLYITDSKQKKKAIAPMLNRQHLNNSSDNPTSRKKRKSKRIKTDKKNTSEKIHRHDNQERSQKTASPSAYSKTGQQKNPISRQKMRPTYGGVVSNKPKNILILSDSMLKTLRRGNLTIT